MQMGLCATVSVSADKHKRADRENKVMENRAWKSPVHYQSNTRARGGLIVAFHHRLLNYLD